MKNINAFTLAEVLITLGIVGVVAAMTIPNLVQNSQEKATITQVKKVYSMLSNAYTLVVQEEGTPDTWGMTAGTTDLIDKLAPYLKIEKNCGKSLGCFPSNVWYKYLNGQNWIRWGNDTTYPKIQLADGTLMVGDAPSGCYLTCTCDLGFAQNVCGGYFADINGYKGPNKWGADVFSFYITATGIFPHGINGESYSFASYCIDRTRTTFSGRGCTAWVVYNENLDYVKPCGTTLSWSGPTSCN